MTATVRVEWWKLKRSPVALTATALMVIVLPAMGLGVYSIAGQGGTGPLAGKAGAMLVGEGWPGYLGAVAQIAAAAMFLGAGIVVAWAFGREHSDRTFASLFALPVSRASIASSKFIVLSAWVLTLSVLVTMSATVLGLLAGVGPSEVGVAGPEVARLFGVALSTNVLALPIGLVASVGRGYLPAIGTLILIVAAAQVSVLFGTGGWFPFAVPGLVAVAGGPGVPAIDVAQIALIPLLSLLCIWVTVRWWQHAEVT